MKVLSTFFAFVITLCAIAALLVSADAHIARDIACPLCSEFVRRVVIENESPRKACRSKHGVSDKMLDGCEFILKEHSLLAKAFDLRSKKTASLSDNDLLDICNLFTKQQLCPHSSESKKRGKLHADSSGWDFRVAPASVWMSPNSVRITVVDEDNTTKHSPEFLSKFDYNANFLHYATEKVVHTGVFTVPQTGGKINVTIGDGLTIPVKTTKPGAGARFFFVADPCFSSEYVHCEWGKKWDILNRLTQLTNLLAKQEDSMDAWGVIGDNFYDILAKLAPQFFTQLSLEALGTPFLTTPGNHDIVQHGGCSGRKQGVVSHGATYLQYYGQNTLASSSNPKSPFNWEGYNELNGTLKPINYTNFYTTTMIGNVLFIAYNGANTKAETMPHFEESCRMINEKKPAVTFIYSHWSALNCLAEEGMPAKTLRDFLVTSVDGCKENSNTILSIEGHTHDNKIVGTNATTGKATSFRIGGCGMSELLSANFGPTFIDTHEGKIQVYYFPIADVLNDGAAAWKTLIDCVESKGGLHQCKHLAKVFLSQDI